ncbi:MAG: hypothetical protein QMB94_00285 [Phycisphaerales bacterium]
MQSDSAEKTILVEACFRLRPSWRLDTAGEDVEGFFRQRLIAAE